jgi:hypothetical protein
MPTTAKNSGRSKARRAKTAALPKSPKKYLSGKIELQVFHQPFKRADLVFEGLDHSGASFEGRVFLNNPSADANTETTIDNGYAGSFHIFGHGGCFGDVGHCEVRGNPRLYDPRPAHQLSPALKVLIATDAVRKAILHGKHMTVTVVPVVRAGTGIADIENVLRFDKLSVRTYS